MRSKFSVRYISIAIILLIVLLFSDITMAQENEFEGILIMNLEGEEISEIYENEYFIVSVFDIEQEETPYVLGVDILFNGLPYKIDETVEIMLRAPEVDSDLSFDIIASKEGYNSTNKTITILNNDSQEEQLELVIIPDSYTVDAGDTFAMSIQDKNGNVVSGAFVAIQSDVDSGTTADDDGRAWLTAPDNKETIVILAQKDGYTQGKATIRINIEEPWWTQFINSQYFPIIIALVFLIFAIVFVNRRQKRAIYSRAKEITDEKTLKKYNLEEKSTMPPDKNKEKLDDQSSIKDTVRIKPEQDPKVEEIRISRPRKEKEIVPVETEEDETEKVINKKKLQERDYDWFEGTDDVRYEIDKLTGEVDEEGLDKWYEGVENLKEKIDEKVKKKDKKKDKEKEE